MYDCHAAARYPSGFGFEYVQFCGGKNQKLLSVSDVTITALKEWSCNVWLRTHWLPLS